MDGATRRRRHSRESGNPVTTGARFLPKVLYVLGPRLRGDDDRVWGDYL
jgi:hypothetical protein